MGVGISHEAPFAADRLELGEAAGDEFVGIDLMAGVPDQPVLREIERQVQRQAELHDPQIAGEVGGAIGDDFAERFADFPGELQELIVGEALEFPGGANERQQLVIH
jgi:hypothetical protein